MDLTSWLLVPGEWLHRLLIGPVATGSETEGEAVVVLGVVFWVLVAVAARVAWHFRAPIAKRTDRLAAPMRARMPAIAAKADDLLARVDSWTPRDVWSVVWRAEAAHLIVYVIPPLAIAAAKLALFYVFLPFSVMSFADQAGPLFRLEPLDRPVCWTFASWCATPLAHYRGLTEKEEATCRPTGECPKTPIVARDPAKAAFKLAWFALALAWVARWHRRRHGPRGRAA